MAGVLYNFKDLHGQIFGKLIVICRDGSRGSRWICECICGTIKSFHSQKLRLGKARSCGCFRNQHNAESSIKHGMRFTPEYKSWCHMRDRCFNPNNPNYEDYGGRGITVYEPWITDFSLFYAEIGPRPGPEYTVDRIENKNGSYMPGNIRWATKKTQNRNRRDNVHLTSIQGETFLLCEWVEKLSMQNQTLRKMLRQGWFIL